MNPLIVLSVLFGLGAYSKTAFITNTHVKRIPYYPSKASSAIQKAPTPTEFGSKIQGVSLGGWLVLEQWITPSLFENVADYMGNMPVDEYTFSQILGPQAAASTLQHHWSSFITEQDIVDIKQYGLNLVRIPIGYWAFGLLNNDPFVQGQEEYLDKAIEWCAANGLKVQVDIHGMPGSQNGFDNSGRRTQSPFWLNNDETRDLTTNITSYVLDKYGHNPKVDSIEMVNEPFAYTIGVEKLRGYYQQVYDMAKSKNVTTTLYFHDGFLPISAWDDFMVGPEYANGVPPIVMDHHIYEIFTEDQIQLNTSQHINNIVNIGAQMRQENHSSIVGEFSGALTDCTKYINGVGTGARYDGTVGGVVVGSCQNHQNYDSWSEQAKRDTREYTVTQMNTYTENGLGWIFWCYKTEDTIEWDFRRATSLGIIPSLISNEPVQSQTSLPSASSTVPGDTLSIGFTYRGTGNKNVIDTGNDTSIAVFVLLSSLAFICMSRL